MIAITYYCRVTTATATSNGDIYGVWRKLDQYLPVLSESDEQNQVKFDKWAEQYGGRWSYTNGSTDIIFMEDIDAVVFKLKFGL